MNIDVFGKPAMIRSAVNKRSKRLTLMFESPDVDLSEHPTTGESMKSRSIPRITSIIALMSALLVSACGGGGGGGSPATSSTVATAPTAASTSFTAQGPITSGDYVSYTVDFTNLTYSYRIVESAYGLTGVTRSGTLVANTDGSYGLDVDLTVKIVKLKSGILLGAVHENFNGVMRTVAFFGVTNPITTAAGLSGIYDYTGAGTVPISLGSATRNFQGTYGELQIDANAMTAKLCPGATFSATCANQSTNTLQSLGGGRYRIYDTNGSSVGSLVAYSNNGNNVLLIDVNNTANGALGFFLGSSNRTVTPADGTGRYANFIFTPNSSGWNITNVAANGTYTNSTGQTGSVALNNPFVGMNTFCNSSGDTGFAVIGGAALFGAVGTTSTGTPFYNLGIGF